MQIAPVVEPGQLVGQRQRQAASVILVQPVLQALAADLGAGARQQLVAVDRPDQIVVGAEIEPFGEARQFALGGDQQDRQLAEQARSPRSCATRRSASPSRRRQAEDDQLDLGVEAAPGPRRCCRRDASRDARSPASPPSWRRRTRPPRRAGCAPARRRRARPPAPAAEAAANLFALAPFLHHPPQPHQRAHAGEERDVVDRLGQEIVGAGLEAAQPVGDVRQRRHHDDRNVGGARVGLQPAAYLEPVHARHHHVEQDDVGQLGLGDSQARCARRTAVSTLKYSLASLASSNFTLTSTSSTTSTRADIDAPSRSRLRIAAGDRHR